MFLTGNAHFLSTGFFSIRPTVAKGNKTILLIFYQCGIQVYTCVLNF